MSRWLRWHHHDAHWGFVKKLAGQDTKMWRYLHHGEGSHGWQLSRTENSPLTTNIYIVGEGALTWPRRLQCNQVNVNNSIRRVFTPPLTTSAQCNYELRSLCPGFRKGLCKYCARHELNWTHSDWFILFSNSYFSWSLRMIEQQFWYICN